MRKAYVYRLTIDNRAENDTVPILISEHEDDGCFSAMDSAIMSANEAAENFWKQKSRDSYDWAFLPGNAKWTVYNIRGYEIVIFFATEHKERYAYVQKKVPFLSYSEGDITFISASPF